ncbi:MULTISPECIES: YifB family Mg chelatase-like AAA ATPase [unclassified Paracoccus (in: a-proteobacteria)]|uniref:YifB family Mg chelatase-like AAA ATPase n=1 Tax=unclassified Paracoccus (in: a-proteobacteria) TaxID=2688777 RepID=UPI0012B307B6|nr:MULTISPECIES: YifB family Mg chelatase-like AAA ATPase [unclassified Paracoccus (in: a-proteobacteria)]UXU74084.1 YifB family Mg chelatase-like AAA ATPase [Paracoccus sp. SMMA_5]UXU79974.1 YifB family Mg chelatase-like AAA ATPase [Paracoccus sp. SMMA_5_TC]
MAAIAHSVAFEGVEARLVEVQCSVAPGLPGFGIVGLPDKAVSEARERIKAAFAALAIAMPARRITINLAPADLPKEGSHFDLPIALAILAALDIVPADAVDGVVALGELALDGRLAPVPGALPAALTAAAEERALMVPYACGPEAAWVEATPVFAPRSLRAAIDHLTDRAPLPRATPGAAEVTEGFEDLAEVKGQERARRAIEIAAAGRHHLLMVGPPGATKTMLARRLPGILPQLTPQEALETSVIHSVAGQLKNGSISRQAPFCQPHHSASPAAIIGGGRNARPGLVSLAHNGVLFLDELPEFERRVIDALREPIETGEIHVSRANAHVRYPARFLLVAAANPCRCGYLIDPARACSKAPVCGADYMGRISGPMMDRFDMRIEVPQISLEEMQMPARGETSAEVAARVQAARNIQTRRFADHPRVRVNAEATGRLLDEIAPLDGECQALLARVSDRLGLTPRGYHRILRAARTIADLDGSDQIRQPHLAEAISFRITAARME